MSDPERIVAAYILARASEDDIQMTEAESIASQISDGLGSVGQLVAAAIANLEDLGHAEFGTFIREPGEAPRVGVGSDHPTRDSSSGGGSTRNGLNQQTA
jgi:hypothetical protein